jgi:insertion element IS1 protein InsB
MINCPSCESTTIVKNGINATGKQNYRCKQCGRQFVLDPLVSPVSDETKAVIDQLLLERISLAGIARVVHVSESWLQDYVNQKYREVPRQLNIPKLSEFRLVVECDELWSFVLKKKEKQWVWIAKDRDSGYVVGLYIGSRGIEGAQGLWNSLPRDYQELANFYTDFWEAYKAVFPEFRHYAVGKESGKTNHVERYNCTLRQRISRLVRKALSFSKKLENHIGAIWYFIHHYNSTLSTQAHR